MQDRLRLVPEVVDMLGGDPTAISAYIDLTPSAANATNDIYKLKAGVVRIYYQDTDRDTGNDMEWWAHYIHIVVKAPQDVSNMDLTHAIVNGIPVPGDGQKWWLCPLFDGLDPTQIQEVTRVSDTESIDYFLIATKINETGDL